MHYNYVFFNSADNTRKKDNNGYYTICVEDLNKLANVHVVSYPVDYAYYFIRCLFSIHMSPRINKFISLPFKEKWYPYYFKNPFKNNKPICFVIASSYITPRYVSYLRKYYPNCKIVKLHRDLAKIVYKCSPEWNEKLARELIDIRMSYDQGEAKKNNWEYFSEFESKIEIDRDPNYPIADVFFAGKAKDRLPKLMKIYKLLTSAGLKCEYYLTGVDDKDKEILPGITYSNTFMPYRDMLYKTVNSRIVLEINQGGAVGYTSRFLEAVMYNKKLVTDNIYIKQSKFYNESNILCIDDIDEKIINFIKKEDSKKVFYDYKNEFSPINLIEQIDSILINRYGDE